MVERLPVGVEAVTDRQLEVARLVAEGRTNPEIAEALGITLDGAKYHVSELLGRLGLERREQIALWYRAERATSRRTRGLAGFALTAKALTIAGGIATAAAIGFVFVSALAGGRADVEVSPTAATRTAPSVTATPTPGTLEPGTVPAAGARGDAAAMPDTLQALPLILAQRLHAGAPIALVSWERVDWTDGCLDLDYPGGCPLSVSPVPGYRVVLAGPEGEYVVRTDLEAGRYRLEAAPPVPPFDIAYTWTGDSDFLCLDLQVEAEGRGSIAGCGEPATPILLSESGVGSTGFLAHVLAFAPFEHATFDAEVRVSDAGARPAGDVARRAALTWGRFLAIESYAGRSGASFALAIGWRDEASADCDHVQLEQYGAAYRSGCAPGGDGVAFLDDEALTRLYGWVDRYAPFEVHASDQTFLVFSGAGAETAPPAVRDEIRAWMAALAAGEGT